jgi:hypothetical protein
MTGGMDASQKHQKMHGRSRNTGIFQYFDTLGNPLKNRRFNVSQGRLFRRTKDAIAVLAAYCRKQWDYLFGDWPLTMPDDDMELIETFFAAAGLSYSIVECALVF